ncbi:hypothetical protein VNO78_23472 [Psophocarpus tetragonolobus]|uniref:Uncharacterized protein n=1 Tax=Psophocarpus tetragonolobus TaxID=3891 RepID=A0AAN9XDU1_PSOTE
METVFSIAVHGVSHGAKRIRKLTQRKAVDYTSTVIWMWQWDSRDRTVLQPTLAAAIDMLPTVGYPDNLSTSFAAKFVHTLFSTDFVKFKTYPRFIIVAFELSQAMVGM